MWSVIQYKQVGGDVKRQLEGLHARPRGRQTFSKNSLPSDDDPTREAGGSPTDSDRTIDANSELPPGCRYASNDSEKSDEGNKEEQSNESDSKTHILVEPVDDYDPINPKNWSVEKKTRTTTILWFLILSQAWAGSGDALANTRARQFFEVSANVMDAGISMYLFGIGVGSLFAGPLSNSTGRNPTYMAMSFLYLCFVLGTALVQSFAGYLIFRFLVGLCASAVLAVNGASIRDMYRSNGRQWVFPLIAWANTIGTYPTLILNVLWLISNRTRHFADRRRCPCIELHHNMAMESMGHIDRRRRRLPSRVILLARDEHADATRLESGPPQERDWGPTIHLREVNGRRFLPASHGHVAHAHHSLRNRLGHRSLRILPHSSVHFTVQFPFRLRLHLQRPLRPERPGSRRVFCGFCHWRSFVFDDRSSDSVLSVQERNKKIY